MHFTQTLPITLAIVGTAMAKNIVVSVSNAGKDLKYTPNDIKADVGDTVEFVYFPKNHTVSESSFQQPCIPLADGTGFNSGFEPVEDNFQTQPSFTYKVADNKPHWFYCAQGKHCQSGMVGVINAPAAKPENNINSFTDLAKKSNGTVIPSKIQGGDQAFIGPGNPAFGGSGSGSNSTASGTTAAGASATVSGKGASGTPYTTAWTYTSNGQAYTVATSENVAGWSSQAYTTNVVYTSNGNVITSASVATQAVPIVATPVPGVANKAMAGAGAAAGLAAAAMML